MIGLTREEMKMNEELQKALLTIVQDGRAFIAEQAPDVVMQILRWGLIQSCMGIAFAVAWFIAHYKLIRYARMSDPIERDNILAEFAGLVMWVGSLVFFVVLLCSLFEIAEILFSPKVYLLDYAKHFNGA